MDRKRLSIEDLEQMTPNECYRVIQSAIVTHINDAPEDLLDRARADITAHIAENEPTPPGR